MHDHTQEAQQEDPPGVAHLAHDQQKSANMTSRGKAPIHGAMSGHAAAQSGNAGINIAVDPIALITTECITVTSAMRKHARWAHSSVSAILGGAGSGISDRANGRLPNPNGRVEAQPRVNGQSGRPRVGMLDDDESLVGHWGRRGKKGKSMQDNPLMSAFARLRSDLRGCAGKAPLLLIEISKSNSLQTFANLTPRPCSILFSRSSAPRPPQLLSRR